MNVLSNIVMTRYVPGYRAHEEFTKSVIRPYRITYKGAKRALVNDGVEPETVKESTVVRIEYAVFAN